MGIIRTKIKTGIIKEPTTSSVYINKNGLTDDTICDTKHHGGIDQAVYIYGSIDYSWWSRSLNVELKPGTFGENLTISDLASSKFNIGDQFLIGDVILEVTAPRIPCVTLATRMNDPGFVKKFQKAEKPGLYCRVINEGIVSTVTTIILSPSL